MREVSVVLALVALGLVWLLNAAEIVLELSHDQVIVTKVVDGDTFWGYEVKNGKATESKYRIAYVDAPESTAFRYGYKECMGEEATAFLQAQIGSKQIAVKHLGKDKYNRLLVSMPSLSKKMLKAGLARTYGDAVDEDLLDAEAEAIRAKRGIWSCISTKGTTSNH